MRRLGRLLAAMVLAVTTIGMLASPHEAEASERTAGTEAELKAALGALSADPSGPHLLTLTDDITLTGGHAVYSGTEDLTIDGDGHSVSGNNNSRVFYFPILDGVTVTLQGMIIENGRSALGAGGYGGGVAVNASYDGGGDLVVINSVVRGNIAGGSDDGGGIAVAYGGDLTLIDSMVIDNISNGNTGGVVATHVEVIRSTIANNRGASYEEGGGIFGESVTLVNSTVSGNTGGPGSGVYSRGPLVMVHSTVAENGPGAQLQTVGADLTSFGSVVAYRGTGNCVIGGATTSTYSYDDGATCGFTDPTDVSSGSDPFLDALGDNGGPTSSRLPGAPLVDQIPAAECDAPVITDQRGVARPQGTGCDIGAVEVVQNQPPVADANGPYMALEGDTVTFDGSGSWDADDDPLTYAWTLAPDDDGFTPQSGVMPTHAFADNYVGNVGLVVEDGNGASDSDSSPVIVSNVSPSIDTLTIVPTLVALGDSVVASATFSDPGTADTHTADWDWGDGSIEPGTLTQDAGSGSVDDTHTYTAPGIYSIRLTVTDDDGGTATMAFQYPAVVYDPAAGFVTGGGWIDSPAGAFLDSPSLTGKATFGFVSKYKKGASIPTGNTEFQFHAAGMSFHSSSYDWLVVTGSDYARFKGVGTINGNGAYKFMIWARDDAPDTFRIKIWFEDIDGNEMVVYDNGSNQAIGGGSIVIHTKKDK